MLHNTQYDSDVEILSNAEEIERTRWNLRQKMKEVLPNVTPCPTYELNIPESQHAFSSYPYLIHTTINLPWDVSVKEERIFLRSHICSGFARTGKDGRLSPCSHCQHLHDHNIVTGIRFRLLDGAHEKTPWAYLTVAQLYNALERKSHENNKLKLASLNAARKIDTRNRHLQAWKRLAIAIGREDIPRVRSLIAKECKNGHSVFSMLEKVDRAALKLYRPRGYEEADFQRAFLIYKLGGRAAAAIAQRTLGIPCINSAKKRIVTASIHSSAGIPTTREILSNLEISYPQKAAGEEGIIKGMTIQVDEMKIQERLRWDPRSNMILGVCREHGDKCALEFRSEVQADILLDCLQKNEVHLATEVCLLSLSCWCAISKIPNKFQRQQ